MARRGKRVRARKSSVGRSRRRRSSTRGLGRGLVELTGLRGRRLGVSPFERRKPGRTLPSSQSLFSVAKPKKRRKKRKKSTRGVGRKRSVGKRRKSKSRKRKSTVGRKRGVGRKRSVGRKKNSRPRMLYGLKAAEARALRDTVSRGILSDSKKGTPFIRFFSEEIPTQAFAASAAGVVVGQQVANLAAAGLVKAGAALFNKEGQKAVVTPEGLIPNVLADFISAGLLYEVSKAQGWQNFGAFASVVAATRSLSTIANNFLTSQFHHLGLPVASTTTGKKGGFSMGAWHEYGYEGGGVGLYRESDSVPLQSLNLYREAEDAPLGIVRVPDGAMLGLNEYHETGMGDDGTLFG